MKEASEYVKKLRALADAIESLDKDLGLPQISHYVGRKEDVVEIIRALGGKWKKEVIGGDKEYACIVFQSENFPLRITISRDRVCKKIVTYDCEPIFAPGEDDAILEEAK